MILLTGLLIYRDKIKDLVSTKWLIIHFIINFAGLYLSYARGAWLGYLLAVPFFFWGKKKVFFSITGIGALILIASIMFNPMAKNRFLNSAASNGERLSYFQAALYAFQEKPIFGLGYKNFQPNSVRLKKKYDLDYKDRNGHAHNNFLEHLSTTGIIGFLFLLLFHFFWFWEGILSNTFLGKIAAVFTISLTISGMTQLTIGDGENLFFIMGFYTLFRTYLSVKNPQEEKSPELQEAYSTY